MQAIHQPLIHGTGIRHSLFLEHFTPSTIYPYPQPAWIRQYGLSSSGEMDGPKIRIVGNLIVAGGPDLRVFEVREEPVLLDEHDEEVKEAGAAARARVEAEQRIEMDVEEDDGFRNIGETDVVQVSLILPVCDC
jgi:cleavage and polyadenylation specificity factor subunit 1